MGLPYLNKEKSKVRQAGTRVGFAAAVTLFFVLLNGLSFYFSHGYRRGLFISAAAVALFIVAGLINNRHKKWVW